MRKGFLVKRSASCSAALLSQPMQGLRPVLWRIGMILSTVSEDTELYLGPVYAFVI